MNSQLYDLFALIGGMGCLVAVLFGPLYLLFSVLDTNEKVTRLEKLASKKRTKNAIR